MSYEMKRYGRSIPGKSARLPSVDIEARAGSEENILNKARDGVGQSIVMKTSFVVTYDKDDGNENGMGGAIQGQMARDEPWRNRGDVPWRSPG